MSGPDIVDKAVAWDTLSNTVAAKNAEIARLRGQLAKVAEAQTWLDERSRNSKSFGHHAFAYEVAARKLREALR